jgi:IS5 family transposase
MTEPSKDQIAKIESIMVTPEENGSPARIEIAFHPGGYYAAVAFARWREALAQAGLVKALFDRFNHHLDAKGYIARGGQIVDATIVSAPKQRNTREENEAIKAGETPEGWEAKPAKNAQKDKDARWTKKNERSFYGYKNHISVDRKHKLIRRYAETDASVHDSQKLDEVLDRSNTSNEVWADTGACMRMCIDAAAGALLSRQDDVDLNL